MGITLQGQGGEGVLRLCRALEHPGRDGAVKPGAGDLFQKCRTFVGFRAQEGIEIALRQQNRATEFVVGQAGQRLNLFTDGGKLACQHLPIRDTGDLARHPLQLAVNPVARAPGGPARLMDQTILGQKRDSGPAHRGPAPQHGARVAGLDRLTAGIGHLIQRRPRRQARRIAIKRQTHRIEDRGFAGPRRPGDRKETGGTQRFGGQVNVERIGKACDVLAADRQDAHLRPRSTRRGTRRGGRGRGQNHAPDETPTQTAPRAWSQPARAAACPAGPLQRGQ